jgi:hypothetical protein
MAQQPVMSAEDFLKALDIFKTNYIKYKTLGGETYNSARGVAQTSIESSITNLRKNVDANNAYISSVKVPDQSKLEQLHTDSQFIQKKGPELQDIYLAEKERKQLVGKDYTTEYVKGAMLAVLLGIAAMQA